MRSDRYFYSAVGAFFLVLVMFGFHVFYLHHIHADYTPIDPGIKPYVVVHGLAITAWFVLFFVQSLLISAKNRKLHMKLGWSVLVIGLTIACVTPIVAIKSVRLTPNLIFFGILFSRFLLTMFMEAANFTFFATLGVLTRKKPKIHRAMMVMACMSLLSGAFSRTPFFQTIFGETGWIGLYGPGFAVGVGLPLIHWAITRNFDKWFAISLTGWAIGLEASIYFSQNAIWDGIVAKIIG